MIRSTEYYEKQFRGEKMKESVKTDLYQGYFDEETSEAISRAKTLCPIMETGLETLTLVKES